MDRAATAARGKDPFQGGVVGHEERAGGASHEDLDPAASRPALEIGKLLDVLRAGPRVEGMVAPGTAGGALQFVFELGSQRPKTPRKR